MRKINSIQKWIPIEKILEKGIIKLKKNKYIKILKVNPINFNLKTQMEKESILNSYKIFLKTCNFDIQILIQSKKEDLTNHIEKIKINSQNENNKFINNYLNYYINYIKEKNNLNKSASKNFYLIIKNKTENNEENIIQELNEKYFKIKDNLLRCGNLIFECDKNEIKKILFSFFNTNKEVKNIKNKKINNNKIKNKYLINNIINKIKKEKNNIKIKEGFFQDKDFFSPTYINLNNPKFLEIDNYFYSGIIITNYFRENNDLILKSLLDTNINMNISIFYEKCDTSKVIKELTYNIGNVGAELKQFNDNRQDIDIAAFTYNDAKYIRKEIQVNNQDIYFLYIYINVYSENKKELVEDYKQEDLLLEKNNYLFHVYHYRKIKKK